jgi:murein L,D-transpeptidase YafK
MTMVAALLLVTALGAEEPVRVRDARVHKTEAVKQLFAAVEIAYPPRRLLLRLFKDDDLLEVWAGDRTGPMKLVTSYAVCARSGELGPKRQQGDLQVPEGFYRITQFNPFSNFHLSMLVDYPNASDRVLGKKPLGGEIYIHGSCVTIGCVPLTDEVIEELYLIAYDTAAKGRAVHAHLFPKRMDDAGMSALKERAGENAALLEFWQMLRPGYLYFEEQRDLPRVSVDARTGKYVIAPPK